jgi:hypothetical protein
MKKSKEGAVIIINIGYSEKQELQPQVIYWIRTIN